MALCCHFGSISNGDCCLKPRLWDQTLGNNYIINILYALHLYYLKEKRATCKMKKVEYLLFMAKGEVATTNSLIVVVMSKTF